MSKPTYEEVLALIQDELGIKLFNYQKELLRHLCDGEEVNLLPARHNPRADMLGYIAIDMLMERQKQNEQMD